ncbi:MAG: ion transporter [Ruminococcus sp.]|nr:ion transporter [Ruminococcus sp.]
MRKRLYEIVELAKLDDVFSNLYDLFMIAVIVLSLVPMAFKGENIVFYVIDKIVMFIFIIDYILRFITADYKLNKGRLSFLIYPITPMALIDFICILPSVSLISNTFKILKLFRLFEVFRVFRVFKAVRYSKSINLIKAVFKKQKRPLITVGALAMAYIMISALIMFNVEPDSFRNYLDAIYWATVSLTTMGYGDISPITTTGRMITVLSALLGVAIIALPSAIVTAGFMEILNEQQNTKKDKKEDRKEEQKEDRKEEQKEEQKDEQREEQNKTE